MIPDPQHAARPAGWSAAGILTVLCIVCLAPFVGKAFHVDDPLYVWAGEHIRTHPLDFYGFAVNWFGTESTMATVMKNPPLTSYYIALASLVLGRSEAALHVAFMVPAVGAVLGTYAVATLLCARPVLAALGTLLTPLFLVSASTLMCDVPMLCFWMWATYCWVRGVTERRPGWLVAGAGLVTLSALSKYIGVSLIPLLGAYALAHKRPLACLPLLIPVAVLAAYQWGTQQLYGQGLLLDAMASATSLRWTETVSTAAKVITALSFTGGGCITAVACLASGVGWRVRIAGTFGGVAVPVALLAVDPFPIDPLRLDGHTRWAYVAQLGLFASCGLTLVAAVARELWRRRDPEARLLALWVAGTLVFAAAANWTVNGRALLPLAPAAGIVAARAAARPGRWWPVAPLAAGAALSLLCVHADSAQAETARVAATRVRELAAGRSGTVWFLGHWGFQYYMQAWGARPADALRLAPVEGDLLAEALNNSHNFQLDVPADAVEVVERLALPVFPWLGTMRIELHAGFYSDQWGALPYGFGNAPPEQYDVVAVKRAGIRAAL